jgi:hypothetical protein
VFGLSLLKDKQWLPGGFTIGSLIVFAVLDRIMSATPQVSAKAVALQRSTAVSVFIAALALITWAAVAYDVYDRDYRRVPDTRDMTASDEQKLISALAFSQPSPGQHFHIFCVNDESCEIANRYRNRLARAGWNNLPPVDQIASDGVSMLTYTEGNDQPKQVSDLTQAFAKTAVELNWENGSGATGATIGSAGPSDEQVEAPDAARKPPLLFKGPRDFALVLGNQP